MRRLLLVIGLVMLAGCAGLAPAADAPADATASPSEPTNPAAEPTPANDAIAASETVTHEPSPDPETDTLGWHDGYWHDDPVSVNATGGLNETELDIVTSRAMARVEVIRAWSFENQVEVSLINRTEFTDQQSAGSGGGAQFEDARYRATFLVGDGESGTERQQETTSQSVSGFYAPGTGEIVIVSNSETPQINVDTLVHELTHALQDQHVDLSELTAVHTQDRNHGRLGLIEGDAETVTAQYRERCGEVWRCVKVDDGRERAGTESEGEQGGASDIHLGLYITSWFPYDDGPGFVASLRGAGGWDRVNEAYERPPNSSREILDPSVYGTTESTAVDLADRSTDEWTRLESGGGSHQRIGQAGLTAMFAYTLYDERSPGGVIDPGEFLNGESGNNRTDLLNYDIPATSGLVGDRLHLYDRDGDHAHVWRLEWNSERNATQFVNTYERLLSYWGGTGNGGIWTIGEDSPFTGVYDLRVEGTTVTISNAPTRQAIENVNP